MHSKIYCHYAHRNLSIDVDGSCKLCCWMPPIGNINDQTIKELWNSPLANEIRNSIENGELHEHCSKVGICPYHKKESRQITRSEPFYSKATSNTPKSIAVYLPNVHCNIGGLKPTPDNSCIMCLRASEEFKPDTYEDSEKSIEASKEFMPYLDTLEIGGAVEPFWNDIVFDTMDKLNFKKYRKQIKLSTVTNGLTLNKKTRTKLLDYCDKSYIQWSMDAATPETYRTIRKVDGFNLFLNNIKGWLKEKTAFHVTTIHNNINLINIKEAEDMVKIAADLGSRLHMMSFTTTFQHSSYPSKLKEIIIKDEQMLSDTQGKLKSLSKKLGVNVQFHGFNVRGEDKRFDNESN